MARLAVFFAAALLLATSAGGADRQARGPEAPAVMSELSQCRTVSDAAKRLACFDTASAKLDAAVAARDVTILDREAITETKRSLFGFATPASGIFNRKDEPEFSEIDDIITSVTDLGYDKYLFTLANKAEWRTTDAMRFKPRAGEKIHIRKAALGAFFLSVGGRRSVKGLRAR